VTFFEIGGILGSFLAGVVTDKWMHKVIIININLFCIQVYTVAPG
jgi:sugar phosphate permease